MSDLISPPLKTDLIGWRRNNSRHKAVSVVSANGDFNAGHVDLLSDHVGELLGTAALFHHGDLHPEKCPVSLSGLTRRDTRGFGGIGPPQTDRCRFVAS